MLFSLYSAHPNIWKEKRNMTTIWSLSEYLLQHSIYEETRPTKIQLNRNCLEWKCDRRLKVTRPLSAQEEMRKQKRHMGIMSKLFLSHSHGAQRQTHTHTHPHKNSFNSRHYKKETRKKLRKSHKHDFAQLIWKLLCLLSCFSMLSDSLKLFTLCLFSLCRCFHLYSFVLVDIVIIVVALAFCVWWANIQDLQCLWLCACVWVCVWVWVWAVVICTLCLWSELFLLL